MLIVPPYIYDFVAISIKTESFLSLTPKKSSICFLNKVLLKTPTWWRKLSEDYMLRCVYEDRNTIFTAFK